MIKTVQLPVEIWTLLKRLAELEDRSISSYLRTTIQQLAIDKGVADEPKKA